MVENNNADLKTLAKTKGVCAWQIADELKISENTLYRMLRYPLDEEKRKAYIDAVNKIAESR